MYVWLCWVSRYWIAMFAAVLCFIYTLLLTGQLWPLRHELPDCLAHALGCMAGLVVIVMQLFVVQVCASALYHL
jgi:hypothetical protein